MAFPIALADDCAGVIEFFSDAIAEPDAQVAAMFATVGGQLAQYLERRRLQADESRRVEAMLRAERDRAQRYLDVAGTMIVVLDPDGEVLLINRKGCAVLDRPEDELLGADWFEIAVPEHEREVLRSGFDQLMRGTGPLVERLESSVAHPGRRAAHDRVAPHDPARRRRRDHRHAVVRRGRHGAPGRAEQQITYLAYHDTLTGPAEPHAARGAPQARARPRAPDGRRASRCCTSTSTTSSWSTTRSATRAGDELICRLAARLQQSVRATDLLARTGGDGFLVLLADLHDDPLAAAERVAGEIGACLAEPFMVAGAEFQVSASIGIALSTRGSGDTEALLAHADSAMYQAKDTARGGWAVYTQAGRDPLERLSMAARLRRALAAEEFQLHYQPIFTSGGALVGVEALLRWHDPERGALVAAERVHPRGRGDRPDRVDRRLGDRGGVRAAGRVGRARAVPADLRQRLAAPAAAPGLPRARALAPARERRRPRRGSRSS